MFYDERVSFFYYPMAFTINRRTNRDQNALLIQRLSYKSQEYTEPFLHDYKEQTLAL